MREEPTKAGEGISMTEKIYQGLERLENVSRKIQEVSTELSDRLLGVAPPSDRAEKKLPGEEALSEPGVFPSILSRLIRTTQLLATVCDEDLVRVKDALSSKE